MDIVIEKLNESYIKVKCENWLSMELSEIFSFTAPNFQFTPSFRNRLWDGKIRLFNRRNNTMYAGLLPKLLHYAKNEGYEVDGYLGPEIKSTESAQIEAWAATLGLPGMTLRDYQTSSVQAAMAERKIIISPTGSGKSLSLYLIYRHFNVKTLLIVPTVSLVKQMYSDLREYGYEDDIDLIYGDADKPKGTQLTISTWQSIFRKPKSWFEKFHCVIGDEVHTFKANSLVSIMEKCEHAKYRIGLSGTLDDSKVNQLTLEGLFGEVITVTTTAELIEQKVLADLKIQCLVMQYPDHLRKIKRDYQTEMDFLVSCKERNQVIRKLVHKLDGNVLVLFQFVEKHGKELYEDIKRNTNRPVYYISGEIKGDERERIRKEIDKEDNAILVASSGTTSTGLNIVSLKHVVFTSPSKAKIKTLQSIGRILRKSQSKTSAVLWDIADNLSWKNRKNYTLKHFLERINIYNREKFQYEVRKVNLNIKE